MMEYIRNLLEARPFVPFSIVTSAGMRYFVASREHAGFNPKRTRITIYFDDDGQISVSALHVTAVEEGASAQQTA